MSRPESVSLETPRHEGSRAAEPGSDNELTSSVQDTLSTQDFRWTRIAVLIGSGISQLPIWGFLMSYGVFQEYYNEHWTLEGSRKVTGVIGTTSNGVVYLCMPFLFALFTRRWVSRRQTAAICGAVLISLGFVLSSFCTQAWQLVATQGILVAVGCALLYSPTTLSLGEWYKDKNRAVAYGVVLSCKNIVGSACPFLFRAMLDRFGFQTTIRIWSVVTAATSLIAVLLIPNHPISRPSNTYRARKLPWSFLKHRTFHIYSVAIILQSSGYGIPATYLGSYARDITRLPQTSATLLLALLNIPGIVSSSFFGYLSDRKKFSVSAATVTSISAISSALSALLFWGLTSRGSTALLVLFSITFGFFAGGYSATWGGVINELELEASQHNEAIDTGMVYGMLNGCRGVGYVSGGLAGVPLLNIASAGAAARFGYGTSYGPLILFTGISSIFGGWGLFWKWRRLYHLVV